MPEKRLNQTQLSEAIRAVEKDIQKGFQLHRVETTSLKNSVKTEMFLRKDLDKATGEKVVRVDFDNE